MSGLGVSLPRDRRDTHTLHHRHHGGSPRHQSPRRVRYPSPQPRSWGREGGDGRDGPMDRRPHDGGRHPRRGRQQERDQDERRHQDRKQDHQGQQQDRQKSQPRRSWKRPRTPYGPPSPSPPPPPPPPLRGIRSPSLDEGVPRSPRSRHGSDAPNPRSPGRRPGPGRGRSRSREEGEEEDGELRRGGSRDPGGRESPGRRGGGVSADRGRGRGRSRDRDDRRPWREPRNGGGERRCPSRDGRERERERQRQDEEEGELQPSRPRDADERHPGRTSASQDRKGQWSPRGLDQGRHRKKRRDQGHGSPPASWDKGASGPPPPSSPAPPPDARGAPWPHLRGRYIGGSMSHYGPASISDSAAGDGMPNRRGHDLGRTGTHYGTGDARLPPDAPDVVVGDRPPPPLAPPADSGAPGSPPPAPSPRGWGSPRPGRGRDGPATRLGPAWDAGGAAGRRPPPRRGPSPLPSPEGRGAPPPRERRRDSGRQAAHYGPASSAADAAGDRDPPRRRLRADAAAPGPRSPVAGEAPRPRRLGRDPGGSIAHYGPGNDRAPPASDADRAGSDRTPSRRWPPPDGGAPASPVPSPSARGAPRPRGPGRDLGGLMAHYGPGNDRPPPASDVDSVASDRAPSRRWVPPDGGAPASPAPSPNARGAPPPPRGRGLDPGRTGGGRRSDAGGGGGGAAGDRSLPTAPGPGSPPGPRPQPSRAAVRAPTDNGERGAPGRPAPAPEPRGGWEPARYTPPPRPGAAATIPGAAGPSGGGRAAAWRAPAGSPAPGSSPPRGGADSPGRRRRLDPAPPHHRASSDDGMGSRRGEQHQRGRNGEKEEVEETSESDSGLLAPRPPRLHGAAESPQRQGPGHISRRPVAGKERHLDPMPVHRGISTITRSDSRRWEQHRRDRNNEREEEEETSASDRGSFASKSQQPHGALDSPRRQRPEIDDRHDAAREQGSDPLALRRGTSATAGMESRWRGQHRHGRDDEKEEGEESDGESLPAAGGGVSPRSPAASAPDLPPHRPKALPSPLASPRGGPAAFSSSSSPQKSTARSPPSPAADSAAEAVASLSPQKSPRWRPAGRVEEPRSDMAQVDHRTPSLAESEKEEGEETEPPPKKSISRAAVPSASFRHGWKQAVYSSLPSPAVGSARSAHGSAPSQASSPLCSPRGWGGTRSPQERRSRQDRSSGAKIWCSDPLPPDYCAQAVVEAGPRREERRDVQDLEGGKGHGAPPSRAEPRLTEADKDPKICPWERADKQETAKGRLLVASPSTVKSVPKMGRTNPEIPSVRPSTTVVPVPPLSGWKMAVYTAPPHPPPPPLHAPPRPPPPPLHAPPSGPPPLPSSPPRHRLSDSRPAMAEGTGRAGNEGGRRSPAAPVARRSDPASPHRQTPSRGLKAGPRQWGSSERRAEGGGENVGDSATAGGHGAHFPAASRPPQSPAPRWQSLPLTPAAPKPVETSAERVAASSGGSEAGPHRRWVPPDRRAGTREGGEEKAEGSAAIGGGDEADPDRAPRSPEPPLLRRPSPPSAEAPKPAVTPKREEARPVSRSYGAPRAPSPPCALMMAMEAAALALERKKGASVRPEEVPEPKTQSDSTAMMDEEGDAAVGRKKEKEPDAQTLESIGVSKGRMPTAEITALAGTKRTEVATALERGKKRTSNLPPTVARGESNWSAPSSIEAAVVALERKKKLLPPPVTASDSATEDGREPPEMIPPKERTVAERALKRKKKKRRISEYGLDAEERLVPKKKKRRRLSADASTDAERPQIENSSKSSVNPPSSVGGGPDGEARGANLLVRTESKPLKEKKKKKIVADVSADVNSGCNTSLLTPSANRVRRDSIEERELADFEVEPKALKKNKKEKKRAQDALAHPELPSWNSEEQRAVVGRDGSPPSPLPATETAKRDSDEEEWADEPSVGMEAKPSKKKKKKEGMVEISSADSGPEADLRGEENGIKSKSEEEDSAVGVDMKRPEKTKKKKKRDAYASADGVLLAPSSIHQAVDSVDRGLVKEERAEEAAARIEAKRHKKKKKKRRREKEADDSTGAGQSPWKENGIEATTSSLDAVEVAGCDSTGEEEERGEEPVVHNGPRSTDATMEAAAAMDAVALALNSLAAEHSGEVADSEDKSGCLKRRRKKKKKRKGSVLSNGELPCPAASTETSLPLPEVSSESVEYATFERGERPNALAVDSFEEVIAEKTDVKLVDKKEGSTTTLSAGGMPGSGGADSAIPEAPFPEMGSAALERAAALLEQRNRASSKCPSVITVSKELSPKTATNAMERAAQLLEKRKRQSSECSLAVINQKEVAAKQPITAMAMQIAAAVAEQGSRESVATHKDLVAKMEVKQMEQTEATVAHPAPQASDVAAPEADEAKTGQSGTKTETEPTALKATVDARNDAASGSLLEWKKVDCAVQQRHKLAKKKRFSPFRVRVGCAVAVRFRLGPSGDPGKRIKVVPVGGSDVAVEEVASVSVAPASAGAPGSQTEAASAVGSDNPVTTKAGKKRPRKDKKEPTTEPMEIWSDPIPGRDDGWALVGQRVRCIFPKSCIKRRREQQPSFSGEKGKDRQEGQVRRILEGEVVSILDQLSPQQGGGMVVSLLADKKAIQGMDFLTLDVGDPSAAKASGVELKRRKYEEIIRGRDKIAVQVTLADAAVPSGIAPAAPGSEAARWVVRKRVLVTSAAKKDTSTSRYVGDGYDAPVQQERNWRWIASRGTALEMRGCATDDAKTLLVGEVIKVVAASLSSPPSSGTPPSLATVTVRRMWLPEHTMCGRLSHHGMAEMFDEATWRDGNSVPPPQEDGSNKGGIAGELEPTSSANELCRQHQCLYEVPVEDLVVLSRKLKRLPIVSLQEGQQLNASHVSFTTSSYCPKRDVYAPLERISSNDQKENAKPDWCDGMVSGTGVKLEMCHRCHRMDDPSRMRRCSSDFCGSSGVIWDDTDTGETGEFGNWWCGECCRHLRHLGLFTLLQRPSKEWTGPCCLGVCDCSGCDTEKRKAGGAMSVALKESIAGGVNGLVNRKSDESPDGNTDDEGCVQHCRACFSPCQVAFVRCESCFRTMHKECASWEERLWPPVAVSQSLPNESMPEGLREQSNQQTNGVCAKIANGADGGIRCRSCLNQEQQVGPSPKGTKKELSDILIGIVDGSSPVGFDLPVDFLHPLPTHMRKPSYAKGDYKKKKWFKDWTKKSAAKSSSKATQKKPSSLSLSKGDSSKCFADEEEKEYRVFKPTCSRIVPYDPKAKARNPTPKGRPRQGPRNAGDVLRCVGRRNFRAQTGRSGGNNGSNGRGGKASSRAARANQRRMVKDAANFGGSSGVVGYDSLSTRESSLRFGKSNIHAWGVFADDRINKGDMIVEYRGILIGNAVANRREKEYEKAKIRSDYMFRIDSETVCDATHQGNVARFINASCRPNCYTKIITTNGTKRIVVYAKRDIEPGEELCYDYKFAIEYDDNKRVPCNCGAPNCRGFMNWDKKYVAIPLPAQPGEVDKNFKK